MQSSEGHLHSSQNQLHSVHSGLKAATHFFFTPEEDRSAIAYHKSLLECLADLGGGLVEILMHQCLVNYLACSSEQQCAGDKS